MKQAIYYDSCRKASIGVRGHELCMVDERKNWRIIYRIDADAIVVIEVFQEKTEETPKIGDPRMQGEKKAI